VDAASAARRDLANIMMEVGKDLMRLNRGEKVDRGNGLESIDADEEKEEVEVVRSGMECEMRLKT
jgi:hypothetical protein